VIEGVKFTVALRKSFQFQVWQNDHGTRLTGGAIHAITAISSAVSLAEAALPLRSFAAGHFPPGFPIVTAPLAMVASLDEKLPHPRICAAARPARRE
jgi:hypothetical protein